MQKLIALLLVVIAGLLAWNTLKPQTNTTAPAQEAAFDRIMRTGTIRCGYALWKPTMYYTNPGDKKSLTGYNFDVMNAVAEVLGLKVEWAEETGWGMAEQGLQSRRYDMLCNDVCLQPTRTKAVYYSMPFLYTLDYFFIREAMQGNLHDFAWLNTPSTTAIVLRNTIIEFFVSNTLPKAKTVDASEMAGDMDMMMNVAMGKADVAFSNLAPLEEFMAKNPGKVKLIDKPMGICQGGFLMPLGDDRLKHMIDSTLSVLNESGKLHQIIAKHMKDEPRSWRTPSLEHD